MDKIASVRHIFSSRLDVLSHLLDVAEKHFQDKDDVTSVFGLRLADNMLPLSAQIIFVCDQARNFSRWSLGEPSQNSQLELTSWESARQEIANAQDFLTKVSGDPAKLLEVKRIDLSQGRYLELTGNQYIDDFLLPNFYFHVTTTYAILRMAGVSIGKQDFMWHLGPLLKQS